MRTTSVGGGASRWGNRGNFSMTVWVVTLATPNPNRPYRGTSEDHNAATMSPRSRASASRPVIIRRMRPRRRWLGSTVTLLTPAAATLPPGTVICKLYTPAAPTNRSPSQATRLRSNSRSLRSLSSSAGSGSCPKAMATVRRRAASCSGTRSLISTVTVRRLSGADRRVGSLDRRKESRSRRLEIFRGAPAEFSGVGTA